LGRRPLKIHGEVGKNSRVRVGKDEFGKVVVSGNLKVGKLVFSGKLSRETDSLDCCGREKDVAPL